MSAALASAIACTALLVASCSGRDNLIFDILVKNASSVDVNDVSVDFPGFRFSFGVLPIGVEASRADVVEPLPGRLWVAWRESGSGETRRAIASVPQELPDKYPEDRYQLLIVISDEGASASIVIDDTASALRRIPEERTLYKDSDGSAPRKSTGDRPSD